MTKRFYITTAIDYVNAKPHLGTAYEKIGADVIARYRRQRGYETLFLMGNDEHSLNVERSARKQGLEPLEYCRRMEEVFRRQWSALDISFDDFIRTTEGRHRIAVETLFRRIDAAGALYEGTYEGHYCESCEAFLAEKDLDEGLCKNHQSRPKWIQESNTFFRLSSFAHRLKRHFQENPDFVRPNRYRNEMLALIDRGLEDISVSRASIRWGIPVPGRPGQVVYVWFDALINYISALGFGSDDPGKFERFWPVDFHVIGKDINRFHSIVWPAMLMAAELPLPKTIWCHGWIHFGGRKMSKSKGTTVDLEAARKRYGADALRYYLLREVAFDRDGDFTWDRFDERYNTDLANTLGNLLSRVVTMARRYRPQGVPRPETHCMDKLDEELIDLHRSTHAAYLEAMDKMLPHQALERVWELLRFANGYVDTRAPWKLTKDPEKAPVLEVTLRNLLAVLRTTCILIAPVMPKTSERAWRQLGKPGIPEQLIPDEASWDDYQEAFHVQKGDSLFPKNSLSPKKEKESGKSVAASQSEAVPAASNPGRLTASFEEFCKIQLVAGKILSAEKIKKSKKLLKLSVDLGEAEPRQIVAGIALAFDVDSLPGRQVVAVANLAPRKIFGLESRGMLLVAQHDGQMEFVSAGDLPPGSTIS